MKKNTIKALTILALPIMYVFVKQNVNITKPMVTTKISKGKVLTRVKVENDEYRKTITISNDSLAISDLHDMYYLTKDNINYRLCQKKQATKLDLNTEEEWIVDTYYDVDNNAFITDYKNYTILTSEEFNKLYGINKAMTLKLTIVE